MRKMLHKILNFFLIPTISLTALEPADVKLCILF